ncbi:MAG: ABC transporter permease, partial [Acidobacteria bacterium]|nr:ABC transporter permease [Acidobacteriota bacterium]
MIGDIRQAASNLRAQKTRTFLTALGIIFGVGSVIGMLSIGSGAREESLRFIEQLGVRNVLVEARHSISDQELQQRRRSSPGLTDRDVRILESNIEALETLSPRRSLRPARVLPKPAKDSPDLFGVRPSYAVIHNLRVAEGRFIEARDNELCAAVCVLGENAKVNLLGYGPVAGKFIKINDSWLEVVGVLAEQIPASTGSSGGQMEDRNNIAFVPFNTF